ncbi:beta-N-acetylhexosaminidase [Paenibacillus sp. 1011MAR3C5]|uniref:beta-N-acetylhexosaminidase n=1 Tax=Paenibacillus sp. 1011MAR3C5 TaxID=1675787 RepID=UPI000E6B78BB|nr:beta-N-acetylhexosaminidase [Paenibacillus sp. 1011MAR3C5]RJE87001.1 beta-N-acetylhexosaminidase [Paenibacillus sp. 1011MAR3C5]
METAASYPQPESNTRLSLEEKIARMCVIGVPGPYIDEETSKRFGAHPIGGLGIFPHNIQSEAQLQEWIASATQLTASTPNRQPLYLSIDEEGGSLSNLKDFYPYMPSNRAVGLADSEGIAHEQGKLIGSQLHEVGIPMNWAPVLDVNTNVDNPVVGIRSFGEVPSTVARLGAAYIAGMHEAGVACTAKHFPGHGQVRGDSHIDLQTCELDRDQLLAGPLLPFQKAIEAGVDSVMLAHIVFPAIPESQGLPASLSYYFATELLRNKLGFQGVICTDDIEMGAIKNNYEPAEIGVMAVLAGNDLILMCHTPQFQEEVMAGIVKAVRAGVIPEDRIDESMTRIDELHAKMASYRALASPVPREQWKERILALARETVKLTDDPQQMVPLQKSKRYLLLVPKLERQSKADNSDDRQLPLARLLASRGIQLTAISLSQNPDAGEQQRVADQAEDYDAVIQGTINAHLFEGQAELARLLAKHKPLLAVILRNPYDTQVLPEQASKALLCSTSDYSLTALAELLIPRGGIA